MRQPWALLRIPMGSYGSTDLWQVFSIFSGSATATRRSLLLLSLSSLFFFLHFLNSLPGYILCTSFARLSHFLWMVLICFDVFLHVFEKLIQKCLRKIRFPPRISPPLCRALSIMLCAFGPCPCLVSDRFGQVHRFVSDLWFVEQERDESGTNRGQMQCKATCQLLSTQKQNRLQSHWCNLSVLRQLPQRDGFKLFGHSNPADYATCHSIRYIRAFVHPCSSDESVPRCLWHVFIRWNRPSRCSAKRMTSDTGSVPGERMKINGVVLILALHRASRKMPTVAQDVLRLPHTTYTTYTTSSWLHHDVSSHVILLCCLCCFGPCFIWFNTFCRRRAESA